MRILIVGELSGFAKELKFGFSSLGHECTVISWGDGKKHIEQLEDDININYCIKKEGVFWKYVNGFFSIFRIKSMVSSLRKRGLYDVCFIISTGFIKHNTWMSTNGLTRKQIRSLIKPQAKVFMSACGTDLPVLDGWQKLRKHPDKKYFEKSYSRRRIRRSYYLAAKTVDYVIPTHYEYAECYRRYANEFAGRILPTIPLPINVYRFEPVNNLKDNKIIVFLGRTSTFKGYDSMSKALDIIIQRHPNVVRVPQKFLPQNEYFKVLADANILMDQCTSFSYAMNALYGLALGKCVMTNNEPECCLEYGVDKMPMVNMTDDVDYIVNQLERLVNNPEVITEIGKKGREYAERMHDSKNIAGRYLKVFSSYM